LVGKGSTKTVKVSIGASLSKSNGDGGYLKSNFFGEVFKMNEVGMILFFLWILNASLTEKSGNVQKFHFREVWLKIT
jgi:hypothetical protein